MAGKPRVLVLNGPNLNLLGTREPDIYGRTTLADIESACATRGDELGLAVTSRQTNSEGELIDWIQGARDTVDGLVINAGGLTHTSVALQDALLAIDLPVIEVHVSNIFKRESFRHHSYVSSAAIGLICGFGLEGYLLALQALATKLNGGRET